MPTATQQMLSCRKALCPQLCHVLLMGSAPASPLLQTGETEARLASQVSGSRIGPCGRWAPELPASCPLERDHCALPTAGCGGRWAGGLPQVWALEALAQAPVVGGRLPIEQGEIWPWGSLRGDGGLARGRSAMGHPQGSESVGPTTLLTPCSLLCGQPL